MESDTKFLLWACAAAAVYGVFVADIGAITGYLTAFCGWLVVGLHERAGRAK
jgi:hypothetical protein